MSYSLILQRLAHYEDLYANFLSSGKLVQAEYAKKSINTLRVRLAQSLGHRNR